MGEGETKGCYTVLLIVCRQLRGSMERKRPVLIEIKIWFLFVSWVLFHAHTHCSIHSSGFEFYCSSSKMESKIVPLLIYSKLAFSIRDSCQCVHVLCNVEWNGRKRIVLD